MPQCNMCESAPAVDGLEYTSNGATAPCCEECSDSEVGECCSCGSRHALVTMAVLQGDGENGVICPTCVGQTRLFRRCECCDDWNHSGDLRTVSGYGRVCDSCIVSSRFSYCDNCEDYFVADDGCRCEEGQAEENRVIAEYTTRVCTVPVGDGPVWAGVELEVESHGDREAQAKAIRDLMGDFILIKNDGSLNNGFEIVTRPASLEVHRKMWTKFFEKRPTGISSWKKGTCGMHVHMTRRGITKDGHTYRDLASYIAMYGDSTLNGEQKKALKTPLGDINPHYPALSNLTVAKMVMFVNAPRNYKLVTKIAGRTGERWARIYEKKGVREALSDRDRYEAINLTGKETIEFRIFRGTLLPGGFFKNLEFCFALKDFCSSAGNSFVECQNSEAFIKFVNSRKKEFPHLHAFITESFAQATNTNQH